MEPAAPEREAVFDPADVGRWGTMDHTVKLDAAPHRLYHIGEGLPLQHGGFCKVTSD